MKHEYESRHRPNIDRLIHWLVLAQIILGLAIIAAIIFKRCEIQPPKDDAVNIHELRQKHQHLNSLADSVAYFEDGILMNNK